MTKEKLTPFESLLKKKICFAVSVSLNTFKNPKVKDTSKDYYLIALHGDISKLKGLSFHQSQENARIVERRMTDLEIKQFKAENSRFNKVLHNGYGRIYELRESSFKAKYEQLKLSTMKELRDELPKYNNEDGYFIIDDDKLSDLVIQSKV
jgi:hypothetical protein